ncbi:MAG: hypothetical protein GXY44_10465 [Phycisphaerales bacterium]|nr:hypothetical protein [Phycisphaerales bacterium]
MPAERNAFKLGLAMILFFVLFIVVLVYLAPAGGGNLTLYVRFPHTQFTTKLQPGAQVTCGGQPAGSIEKIELRVETDENSGYEELFAIVTCRVRSSLGLRKDCVIRPVEALLGGMGELVIKDRGLGDPVQAHDIIDGAPTPGIDDLKDSLAGQLDPNDPSSLLALLQAQLKGEDPRSTIGRVLAILDDLQAVSRNLRNEFDPGEQQALLAKLHSILGGINDLTHSLRTEMDRSADQAAIVKIHDIIDSLSRALRTTTDMLEDNRTPIHETIKHVRSTAEMLDTQIVARIASQLDPTEAAGLLAKVHVALDRLNGSLKDIGDISAAGREVVVLNTERLHQIIGNFKETSDHLKATSKELRRNPWRLLYQPTLVEAEQANLHDSATAFAEAATRLDDAIARLQALQQAGGGTIPADDRQLAEIIEHLHNTFSRFHQVETALWQQLKIK